MTQWLKQLLMFLTIFIVGGVVGYYVGRSNREVVTKTQRIYSWSKGKEIIKEIPIPEPEVVYKTIEKEVPIPIDTAALYAVWCDYHNVNKYTFDFSDDSVGVFKVDFSVSENRVSESPKATIQPNILTITETNTVYKVPTIQGYAMIGASVNLNTFQVQAGIDVKQKFLIGASGIRLNNAWGYTVNFGMKF